MGGLGQWAELYQSADRVRAGTWSATASYVCLSPTRSVLLAWSKSTRSCCLRRTGCSRLSPRYWQEQSGRWWGGGDDPREGGYPEDSAQSIGGASTTSSWECGQHQQSGCFLWCSHNPRLVFSSQALLAVKSVPVDEDPETKVPVHPEDGAPQPGNSKVRGSPVGVH